MFSKNDMFPFLPAASTALGLGFNIANYIDANNAQNRAQKGLDQLSAQPWERYNVNPAVNRYYQLALNQGANPYGFTGAERTNFTQQLGQSINSGQTAARNMTGGNLGKAINFLSVNPQVNALNSFAAQDANLRRQFQNNAYGRQFQATNIFQNVGNMNTQTALARRMQALQAYGNAVNTNRDFKRNLFSGLGGDLLGAGVMSLPGFRTLPMTETSPNNFSLNPNMLNNYTSDITLPSTQDALKGLRRPYYSLR